jgi:hypothetical protein
MWVKEKPCNYFVAPGIVEVNTAGHNLQKAAEVVLGLQLIA